MRTLTATELLRMRGTQGDALPSTCTIERATLAADAIGVAVETWAEVATDVDCRLANEVTTEDEYGNRVSVIGQFVLTLPHGTDIAESDRVTIGSNVYQVTGVLRGSWETCERLSVAEVT